MQHIDYVINISKLCMYKVLARLNAKKEADKKSAWVGIALSTTTHYELYHT